MPGTVTADAVIIGGGINGAAISFYLSRAGMRVIVLESSRPGAGASSRGAGIVRTYHDLPAETLLAIRSLATFRNWRDEIGGDCGYRASGFLWMVGPDEAKGLAARVAAQRQLGADVRVMAVEEMVALQPHLSPEGIGAVAWEPQGGFGEPMAATSSLHAAAARLGARLVEAATARLLVEGGRIAGAVASGVTYAAPVVVLAAGAWSAAIAAPAGVRLPVISSRMTTGVIQHAPFAAAPATFIDTVTDTFFRPSLQEGCAHVSIRDDRHNIAVDPSSNWPNDVIAATAAENGIDRLRRRIPGLAAEPFRAWAGIDGVTPDYRPIYGPAPEVDGLWLCVGGSFKGFKVAPAVGQCLAALIAGEPGPGIDLAPFRLDRFASADMPAGPPAYALSSVA